MLNSLKVNTKNQTTISALNSRKLLTGNGKYVILPSPVKFKDPLS